MRASLDHLVFGVSSLEHGSLWLEERLGAPLSPGGRHEAMGTHNRLLRLGDNSYLELIAIDPEGSKPQRPRWFDLDSITPPDSLQAPRLLTWAAATTGLTSPGFSPAYDAGKAHAMSRGALSWLITIRDDGRVPEAGTLPSLIEWPEGVHPATALPGRGVSLTRLELFASDPDRTEAALKSIGLGAAGSRVRVVRDETGSRLRAILDTPRGIVCFDSRSS
jgi:hypothetical protein